MTRFAQIDKAIAGRPAEFGFLEFAMRISSMWVDDVRNLHGIC